jgi:hypothetical protein
LWEKIDEVLHIYIEEAGGGSGVRLCLIGVHLLNTRPQKSKMPTKYSRLNIKIVKNYFLSYAQKVVVLT